MVQGGNSDTEANVKNKLDSSSVVGERLKLIRKKMGFSQRELARRADLTNGTLSNIEQGKVSPSIASLEKILDAIPMSMQEFFSESLDLSPAIYRSSHFVKTHKNNTDYLIMPLNEAAQEGAYLARQTYAPGARVSSEWMVNNGMIAGIVISGELELTLEGVSHTLNPGEGFSFSIQRSHIIRNSASIPSIVVCVSFSI